MSDVIERRKKKVTVSDDLSKGGWGDLCYEDFVSTTLRCLRASKSCLVIRVPRSTSQCMKHTCEKLDFIPIVCDRIQYEVRSNV